MKVDASVASTSRASRESGYTYTLANGGTLSLTKYVQPQEHVAVPLCRLIGLSICFATRKLG